MPEELETVVENLRSLIGGLVASWERPLPRRIYLAVSPERAREAARALFERFGARFVTATGQDMGNELEALYHFCYDSVGLVINMRVRTPKSSGVLPSITPVVPAAEWIEREMRDLLGIEFEGHPRPERLILSDDWPDGVYPLRREHRK